jgi:hypothetical protein
VVLNFPHLEQKEQWDAAAIHSRNWEPDVDMFEVSKVC